MNYWVKKHIIFKNMLNGLCLKMVKSGMSNRDLVYAIMQAEINIGRVKSARRTANEICEECQKIIRGKNMTISIVERWVDLSYITDTPRGFGEVRFYLKNGWGEEDYYEYFLDEKHAITKAAGIARNRDNLSAKKQEYVQRPEVLRAAIHVARVNSMSINYSDLDGRDPYMDDTYFSDLNMLAGYDAFNILEWNGIADISKDYSDLPKSDYKKMCSIKKAKTLPMPTEIVIPKELKNEK